VVSTNPETHPHPPPYPHPSPNTNTRGHHHPCPGDCGGSQKSGHRRRTLAERLGRGLSRRARRVTINLDVALRVVAILQYEGYDAEILAEYDDKLPRYRADAFLSIHTDSCEIPELSGFKVARLSVSSIPEIETGWSAA